MTIERLKRLMIIYNYIQSFIHDPQATTSNETKCLQDFIEIPKLIEFKENL